MVATRMPGAVFIELDELTLRRAQTGDAAACRTLVKRYELRVFGVLTRMVAGQRSRALVEDLAQETFLRVFRELHRFVSPGPARLSTWILTIATRLAIDELRRVQALPMPPLEPAGHGPSPSAQHESAELQRVLERALASLSVEHRDLFVLNVIEEIPYEEMARALDLELGTVKSRLSRAKALIRLKLQEAGHGVP